MVFQLSHFWLIFLNILTWIIIHLGISYACTKIPLSSFNRNNWLYRIKKCERQGKLYLHFFKIKSWKNMIPDGAKLFRGGFPKKNLESCDSRYLNKFMLETCRGELTHWLQILPAGIFFLWNVWWSGLIMIAYALIANIPCILLQRYNRARLIRVIDANKNPD
ncbi:MAG: glycosyl-4,4'-diaponeurosporenoate acyltransferase [Actinobacteria bacterium]|nr:glycosyl-4,4'-diaponeurosporenoate acyltransferase [Actinomycetota bacterium]